MSATVRRSSQDERGRGNRIEVCRFTPKHLAKTCARWGHDVRGPILGVHSTYAIVPIMFVPVRYLVCIKWCYRVLIIDNPCH